MVSRQRFPEIIASRYETLVHKPPFCPDACSRLPAAAAIFVLLVLLIAPVMAVCQLHTSAPHHAYVGEDVPIQASITGCTGCTYQWTINQDYGRFQELFHFPSFTYAFTHPGQYYIHVHVIDDLRECPSVLADTRVITILSRGSHGVDGDCYPPEGAFSLLEYPPSGPFSVSEFIAQPHNGHSCTDCVYTWTLKRSLSGTESGPYEIVHHYSEDPRQGATGTFQHRFMENGVYLVGVSISNPPDCQGSNIETYRPDELSKVVTITGQSESTAPGLPESGTLEMEPRTVPAIPYIVGVEVPPVVDYSQLQGGAEPVVTVSTAEGDLFADSLKTSLGGVLKKNLTIVSAKAANISTVYRAPAQTPATPGFTVPAALVAGLLAIVLIGRRK